MRLFRRLCRVAEFHPTSSEKESRACVPGVPAHGLAEMFSTAGLDFPGVNTIRYIILRPQQRKLTVQQEELSRPMRCVDHAGP